MAKIADKLDRNAMSIYLRLKRFDKEGIAGLEDKPRSGRKPTYTESERGTMIALVRTNPDKLGLPYGHWTLDRLVDYLHGNYRIGVSRAQLARNLQAEGCAGIRKRPISPNLCAMAQLDRTLLEDLAIPGFVRTPF